MSFIQEMIQAQYCFHCTFFTLWISIAHEALSGMRCSPHLSYSFSELVPSGFRLRTSRKIIEEV